MLPEESSMAMLLESMVGVNSQVLDQVVAVRGRHSRRLTEARHALKKSILF